MIKIRQKDPRRISGSQTDRTRAARAAVQRHTQAFRRRAQTTTLLIPATNSQFLFPSDLLGIRNIGGTEDLAVVFPKYDQHRRSIGGSWVLVAGNGFHLSLRIFRARSHRYVSVTGCLVNRSERFRPRQSACAPNPESSTAAQKTRLRFRGTTRSWRSPRCAQIRRQS